jgi:signal transduction histidine kinase
LQDKNEEGTMPLTTEFAPPERAVGEEIAQAVQYFADYAYLTPFLDAVPNIYLILNRYRQIVFANRVLFETFGVSPAEVYGQRPGEALACEHAFETPGGCGTTAFCRTCGAVRAILSSLKGRRDVQECRITQSSGTALDLRVWATPLELNGELYSIFALEDISSEKRRRALEHIFFHDLLNTAGVISGYAAAFKDGYLPPTDEHKEVLYRNALRLIAEIDAQRELSAAENNELAIRQNAVNTLDLLREIMAVYGNHPAAADKHIRIVPDAEPVLFTSDSILLGRVLGNMLKNALEACEPGQAVTLNCFSDGDCVVFEVHNPCVMPRDVQLQVFQRSFSTKGPGRGLGTYSMKLLTERYLNGTISFTSTPGHGTIFRAAYPLRRGDDSCADGPNGV